MRPEQPRGFRRNLLVSAEVAFLAGVVLLPIMRFATVDALGTAIIPSDVCFGLAAVCAFLAQIGRRDSPLRGAFALAVVGYLAALVIAAAASPHHRESAERIAIDGYCIVLGLTTLVLAQETATRVRIARAWVVGTAFAVAAALVGLALFYAGERTPAENFAIGDLGSIHTASVPRVVGFFLNANLFCSYLVVGLLFTLGVVGLRRPLGVVLAGAIGISLVFTLSPGLGGATVAVSLWLVLSQPSWSVRSRRLVAAAGAAGAVAFLVLTIRVGPRLHTWADAFDTFRDAPLVGRGPGSRVAATFYEGRFFTDAHNAWLNVAGQAGLVGLLALVGVVSAICVLAWRARPLCDVAEPVRAGWCAFVGAVLFGSLSLSLEQSRHVWILLGFLAAGLETVSRRSVSVQHEGPE